MNDIVERLHKLTDGFVRNEQEDGSPIAVMMDAMKTIEVLRGGFAYAVEQNVHGSHDFSADWYRPASCQICGKKRSQHS